jgi:methionyl aminopeptidase
MITLKSRTELETMRQASRIVARVLAELEPLVRPGIRTRDLDLYAEKRVRELGAVAAFKGYRGYPASVCVSVNEEIIHGIPSGRIIQDGDLVSLDFGVLFEGFYGDAAVTVPAGEVSPEARRLAEAAEEAFRAGFKMLKVGNRVSDISAAVQKSVEAAGFSVIRQFVGHGIGRSLHEEPQVPNFGNSGRGPKLKPGMTLAIEPMIAFGDWEAEVLADGWTAVTRDRSLSAHFEHTIALTEDGPEILTDRAIEMGGPRPSALKEGRNA